MIQMNHGNFKNTVFLPGKNLKLKKHLFGIYNMNNHSFNKTKSLIIDNFKDLFNIKQKIFYNKYSSRNKNHINKLKQMQSAITKKNTKSQIGFASFHRTINLKTDKTKSFYQYPCISSYFEKNNNNNETTLKRNYSSYSIKSDFYSRTKYITDLIRSKENTKDINNKTQKMSDIEQKIKNLERNLNISNTTTKSKSFCILKTIRKNIKKPKEEQKESVPYFFKDNFKIKGTNIISPFCKKIRDNFMLKKINMFLNEDENDSFEIKKKSIIDNKLNIIYAENKKMYQNKLRMMNKRLLAQGKKEKYKSFYSPSEKQLKDMEKKITFIKDVFEFAFPRATMIKFNQRAKKLRNKKFEKNKKIFEHMNKTYHENKNNIVFNLNLK